MQQSKLALQDIIQGTKSWRIWLLLSWQDIKLRYRRSQLGPFWITFSMAITIYTMGFLYGEIFRVNLSVYFPFLASGMLAWALISTIINESAQSFVEAEPYLKQMKIPFSIFILRVVSRNVIIFLHNIVVLIPIILYFHVSVGWQGLLYALLGVALLALNGFIYGILFAMLGSRFRDITQIIQSLVQVAFFLTPIMWLPHYLPEKYHAIVNMNPFAQFVAVIRDPLTGHGVNVYAIEFSLGLALVGAVITFLIFQKMRRRIIYWL